MQSKQIQTLKQTVTFNDGNRLNEWKNTRLNIGIFGDSSDELKQLLIDKLTSYGPRVFILDPRVNVYQHRNNSKIQVWDMNLDKDITSSNFDFFMSNVSLDSFDIFILFRKNTFSDFDQKIYDFLTSKGKKIFFVGVEQDSEIKLSSKINTKVYLITKDDLSKLNEDIIENLSDDKMTAFVLTIDPLSKEIIQKKTDVLKSRSGNVSARSGLFGSLITGPGFAIIADLVILSTEIWFYRKQLGLTDENLKKISQHTRSAYETFLDTVTKNKYGTYVFLKDINAISNALIKTIPTMIVSDIFDIMKFIPVVGTVLHGTASIAASKSTLVQILDELSRVAMDIQNLTSNKPNVYRSEQTYQSYRY